MLYHLTLRNPLNYITDKYTLTCHSNTIPLLYCPSILSHLTIGTVPHFCFDFLSQPRSCYPSLPFCYHGSTVECTNTPSLFSNPIVHTTHPIFYSPILPRHPKSSQPPPHSHPTLSRRFQYSPVGRATNGLYQSL